MSATRTYSLSKIALVISLAVNLAVAGLVTGAWLSGDRWHSDRGDRGSDRRWSAGPYGRALSEEDRREMGERFRRGAAQDMRGKRAALRAAGQDMVTALRAEPFDDAEVAEILKRQGEIGAAQRAIGYQILREQIVSMTPAERSAFADRLEEALSRRRPARDPAGG